MYYVTFHHYISPSLELPLWLSAISSQSHFCCILASLQHVSSLVAAADYIEWAGMVSSSLSLETLWLLEKAELKISISQCSPTMFLVLAALNKMPSSWPLCVALLSSLPRSVLLTRRHLCWEVLWQRRVEKNTWLMYENCSENEGFS